jgi:carbon-monoxide dehydrogenase medium subunit
MVAARTPVLPVVPEAGAAPAKGDAVKAASFAYSAPTSVPEAVDLLAEGGDDAKVLAGGQSLVPILALRLSRFGMLVDLNRVDDLDYVRHADDHLVVGAMTRQATIEEDLLARRYAPVLAKATRLIGHFQIRNRGTLGGSVAHGDPAAEYPAVAVALDARMNVVSRSGTRRIAARDFFVGPMTNALVDGELLESVAFPVWAPGSGFAVREAARREGDFAAAGVVAAATVESHTVTRVAVALFGMGPTPIRLDAVEAGMLGADPRSLDLTGIGREGVADLQPPADVHASGGYRRRVGAVLVAQALGEAFEEAAA